MKTEKSASKKNVQKNADGSWSFRQPGQENTWVGSFKTRDAAQQARNAASSTSANEPAEKVVDSVDPAPVDSLSDESTSSTSTGNDALNKEQNPTMSESTVTFTRSDKARKSTSIVFANASLRGGVRVPKTFFPKDAIPESVNITAVFVEPKKKLSAEERKAARANAPKLTPAQRLAKLEERAQKLRDKVAKEAAAAAPASA